MINVDLRRYGTDEEYKQFINGYISGADIDETPTECQLVRSVKEATDEELEEVVKGEFHCGIEESGFHAYNCNDCPNKCDVYYQWDKEMKGD